MYLRKNNIIGIRDNIKKIEEFCNKEKLPFNKPILVLGVFERVGSNLLLDILSQHAFTHNEPFKQQLGKESNYSTMSTRLKKIVTPLDIRRGYFLLYWLKTFVSTKYGITNHVVKETNLFFALKNFLELFLTQTFWF